MIQLIQAATLPKSNEERLTAEKALIEHRQANPNEFFQEVATVFKSNQVPDNIRQASGTIMAVSVLAKSKTGAYIWDVLDGNFKTNIKDSILEVLIDPDRNVRRAAANIVSAICSLQLPRNEWDGIVEKICVNISHDNQIVKQASILTLGFICSRMRDKSGFEFSPSVQESIATGIVMGIQQPDEQLVQTSLKALQDSVSSLHEILKNPHYREFLLKEIGDIVNGGKFTLEGLHILGEFVKTIFEYMGPYLPAFYPLLEPFMCHPEKEDTCVAAMEIWENIAAESKDSDTNSNVISGQIGQKIVTLLLKNLCVMESQDLEQNLVSESASKALETIFDNGSQEYKQLVLEFVRVTIAQNDWKQRQASIKAFSLVLLGLPPNENIELITGSINQLMGLLSDSSIAVQYATLESLVIISEECGGILLRSENFLEYLKVIVSKIYVCEKFLKAGCKIVENLCEAQKECKLSKFSQISDDLIGALLQISLEPNSSLSTISWSMSAMMSVIEVANSELVSRKYIAFVLENFGNISQVDDSEKRETLASAFFTISQYCLHSLKGISVDMAVISALYEKVVTHFKAKNDVTADGLYCIEALISFFQGDSRLVEDFWPYIQHALSKHEDPTLFRATIICIGAFLSYHGEGLAGKLSTFVPQLIELVKNPGFNREMKLDCLLCLGEVCLNCPQSSTVYLASIIEVVMLCCTAAIGMSETDFAYSELLKDSIVECLMCIVHGLNFEGSQIVNQLTPYVSEFFRFIVVSLEKKYKPTVAYFNRSILLLADIARYYPMAVAQWKKDPVVQNTINTFKNFSKNGEYGQTIKYAEAQLK